jgi:hypothetical protein
VGFALDCFCTGGFVTGGFVTGGFDAILSIGWNIKDETLT